MRNKVDNNQLINDFLGQEHHLCCTMSAPDFENSWSWIMPVYVHAVDSLEGIKNKSKVLDSFFPPEAFYKTEYLYQACVSYIKFYNYSIVEMLLKTQKENEVQ